MNTDFFSLFQGLFLIVVAIIIIIIIIIICFLSC
jgi:hypothetical protein